MRLFFLFCLLSACCFTLNAQVLQDDFSDGNFTANPTWSGDVGNFIVSPPNILQTNDSGNTATSQLSTAAAIQDTAFWEFYVQLDFAPSTSNYTRIYLQADNADLTAVNNGYYLQIGSSGLNDALEIYRVDAGSATLIFSGTAAAVATNPTASIRINRSSAGLWEVFADYTGGTSYISEGTFTDATHTSGSHFGLLARYTSTRGNKFFFDNIYLAPLLVDLTPPSIDSIAVLGANAVDVYFDEVVDLASSNTSTNYTISSGIAVLGANRDASNLNLVHLNTAALTSNQTYFLTVNGVTDLFGNILSNGLDNFIYYNVQAASFQDIIINEIHEDPSPVIGLPNAEFVELYNRSNKIIDLSGWVLDDGVDRSIPSFLLFPDSFVILTASTNVAAYSSFGTTLNIGSLSLTNGGELIRLKDNSGQIIDSAHYDMTWYQDPAKDDGGWTLELINPNLLCQGSLNWRASNDNSGGTPGRQNSIFNNTPDNQGPSLLSANFLDANTIQLIFDEPLDANNATSIAQYNVPPLTVSGVNFLPSDKVTLNVSTMVDQTTYTVTVSQLTDCSGNPISANNTANFTYVQVQPASYQDILINEIHADPSPVVALPNAEFVELYNRSNKTIDLGNWILNDGSSDRLISNNVLLAPDSFVILTSANNASLYNNLGTVLPLPSLSLSNSGKLLTLKDNAGTIIDTVNYTDDWYQDASKDDGGWTLELVNPNLTCQGSLNWRASNDNSGGTPGQQNSIFNNTPDTQGPNLLSARFLDSNRVELIFDEPLGTNASNLGNYTLSGITINTAQLVGNSRIMLTLSSNMVDQTIYTVTVSLLTDCSGNAVAGTLSANFTYYLVQEAQAQDLIITEIYADPTPSNGLPDAEFIELYNRSNKTIDLNNYRLFEATTHVFPSQIMQPNTYAIVCASANQGSYAAYGTVVPINSLSLTNSGEALILYNANGQTLDSLVYDQDWYRDNAKDDGGWSLELVNPNELCKGSSNWRASLLNIGGSPGTQNSVFDNTPDQTAPSILTARQFGNNQILLEFDDVLDKVAASTTSNFSINNGATVVTVICLSGTSVLLTLGTPMVDQTTYTITLNNISDCVGNNMGVQTVDVRYFEAGAANHYDIIINEIMADPNPVVGLPEKEYIELYNRSNKTFNLENFTFTDRSTVTATLPFFILNPGEYVTLYSNTDSVGFSAFGNVLPVSNFPDLNTSDELILSDEFGEVIDAVAYTLAWYQNADKDDGGWSLERINPERPCEGMNNWRASENLLGGTPSTVNSVLDNSPDVQSPDALRAFPLAADSIRVYFNEAMDDLAGITVSNYSIDQGINVLSARLEPPFYSSVILRLDQPLTLGTTYTVTMDAGLTDCVGNPIALKNTVRLALPQNINAGDLILNEILFNPVTGGRDFVELYNHSNKVLNAADLIFSNAKIVDGNLVNTTSLQTRPVLIDWLIFPQEYVVITEDADQVRAQYNPLNPDWMVENDLPTYDNKEGSVFLYAAYDSTYIDNVGNLQTLYLARTLDRFDYLETFHSPLIDDKNGVSLERIDFDAPTNDPNNWHSAATKVGYGTPTYLNSNALSNTILGDETIQLPTETVSPDGDGYEDFLLINYNLDALGYVANIDIYDANGRLIRNLINGELLQPEGSLQWDGTDNQGRKARVGIHILTISLFNPNGDVKRLKKTCIVAGRMN